MLSPGLGVDQNRDAPVSTELERGSAVLQGPLARALGSALVAADLAPLSTEHAENQLAAARFFAEAISDVA